MDQPPFWNDHVKEHYHTRTGARLEAEEKYVQPAHLHEQLQHDPIHLLDILLWTRLQQPCRAKRHRCHSSPTHHRT